MTVKTHPLLPDLPAGQFWRVYTRDRGIEFVYVELRRHGKFWSRRIDRRHALPDTVDRSARKTASWLADRILTDQKFWESNVLGDLEGDHPA